MLSTRHYHGLVIWVLIFTALCLAFTGCVRRQSFYNGKTLRAPRLDEMRNEMMALEGSLNYLKCGKITMI